MAGLHPDTTGLSAIHNQAEFKQQLWQHLNRATTDWKITAGKAAAQQYVLLLARIEKDFGVELAFMLGVWGIESAFGDPIVEKNHMRPVIPSLAALAWGEPRRRTYWEGELIHALIIVQRDMATPEQMIGSWAGAMGHTQWMPEVWLNVGIDYDGDGRIFPYGPPDDALASTARFFVDRGKYRRGEHWGHEVRMPASLHGHGSRTYAGLAGARRYACRRPPLPAAGRQGRAVDSCSGRTGLPARREFLCRQKLQSVDELCAGAGSPRQSLRRRRTVRTKVPGQRTGTYAGRSPGNPAPAHRVRLRYRRH
jgi:membrane-bound lytic murein transglycosylase B